jgi:hypothetical protein
LMLRNFVAHQLVARRIAAECSALVISPLM